MKQTRLLTALLLFIMVCIFKCCPDKKQVDIIKPKTYKNAKGTN